MQSLTGAPWWMYLTFDLANSAFSILQLGSNRGFTGLQPARGASFRDGLPTDVLAELHIDMVASISESVLFFIYVLQATLVLLPYLVDMSISL